MNENTLVREALPNASPEGAVKHRVNLFDPRTEEADVLLNQFSLFKSSPQMFIFTQRVKI